MWIIKMELIKTILLNDFLSPPPPRTAHWGTLLKSDQILVPYNEIWEVMNDFKG